jgi:hypothetical protein
VHGEQKPHGGKMKRRQCLTFAEKEAYTAKRLCCGGAAAGFS